MRSRWDLAKLFGHNSRIWKRIKRLKILQHRIPAPGQVDVNKLLKLFERGFLFCFVFSHCHSSRNLVSYVYSNKLAVHLLHTVKRLKEEGALKV